MQNFHDMVSIGITFEAVVRLDLVFTIAGTETHKMKFVFDHAIAVELHFHKSQKND